MSVRAFSAAVPVLLLLMLHTLAVPAKADTASSEPEDFATTIKQTTHDMDVVDFTFPPNEEFIAKACVDQATLAQTLDTLMGNGAVNTAAFIARYAAPEYDAFIQAWIQEHIAYLPPPFFFVMSAKIGTSNTEEALRWHLRGYVLSVIDAELCRDSSAKQGVLYVMSLIGEDLFSTFRQIAQTGIIDQERKAAVEYAHNAEQNYTPMWLCSHGISSFTDGSPGYYPLETRTEKLEAFAKEYLQQK